MPRKKMTPAERKAWGEKMKLAKEAKAKQSPGIPARVEEPVNPHTATEVSASAPETISQDDDVEQLKKHVAELQGALSKLLNQPQQANPFTAQVTARGLIGTREKFPVDPKYYPSKDEIFERLLGERRLSIQGFNRDWWDIYYEVASVNYETKDGINTTEPKFRVELVRILPDPETNEPSNRRYTLHKLTLFEDPAAAIQVARQYGLEVDESNEKGFLDEMRYLRIRDWVLESFYPPKPTQAKANKVETVIENRLVEVYEINSVNAESIPFNELKKKL